MSRLLPRIKSTACGGVAFSCAMLAGAALPAQTVTLRSVDGDFVLTGEIAALSDGAYILEGPLGALRVDAARVTCEGAACPAAVAQAPDSEARAAEVPGVEPAGTVAAGPAPAAPPEEATIAEAPDATAAPMAGPDFGFAGLLDGVTATEPLPGVGHRLSLAAGDVIFATGADALDALSSGAADLALVAGMASGAGLPAGYRLDVLAHDAVAVVSHPSNPVAQLTLDEIRAIYAGQITNWSEVSGPDSPIRVIEASAEFTSPEALEAVLFSGREALRAITLEPRGGAAAIDAVSADPTAIAFVRQADLGNARPIEIVDACGLQAAPDALALKSGTYPLLVPVALVSPGSDATPAARALVDLAMSAANDAVYASAGLVDRAIQRVELVDRIDNIAARSGNSRTAQLAEDLRDAASRHERLTLAFQFGFGATRLEAPVEADFARLADYLSGLPTGSRVKVAGFSDDIGAPRRNLAVAAERARNVVEILQRVAGSRLEGLAIEAVGYGDLMPVACNSDPDARAINRRVEIWIEAPVQG